MKPLIGIPRGTVRFYGHLASVRRPAPNKAAGRRASPNTGNWPGRRLPLHDRKSLPFFLIIHMPLAPPPTPTPHSPSTLLKFSHPFPPSLSPLPLSFPPLPSSPLSLSIPLQPSTPLPLLPSPTSPYPLPPRLPLLLDLRLPPTPQLIPLSPSPYSQTPRSTSCGRSTNWVAKPTASQR